MIHLIMFGFYLLLGLALFVRYGDVQDGFLISLLVGICFIFLYPIVLASAAIND